MNHFDQSFIQYLKSIVSSIPCTYAEIRLSSADRTSIALSGNTTDSLSSGQNSAGSIRIYDNGSWAFLSFNDVQNIALYAEKIKKMSTRLDISQGRGLIRSKPITLHTQTNSQKILSDISTDEKIELIQSYNKLMLDHSKIQSTRAVYRDTLTQRVLVNSEGSELVYDSSFCGISLKAIARDGNTIESSHTSHAGYGGFETVEGFEEKAQETAQCAVDLLKADVLEGGHYPVIIDPRLAGVFIHEAFGHLSEADFVYENCTMKEKMPLGRRLGQHELNVIDDGTIPFAAGFIPLDDEGILPEKTLLIREGMLNSRLHSRETAFLMEEDPTGNARAISVMDQPLVRMTNTYIDKGSCTKDDLFNSVNEGIYAVNAYGGQTNLDMFTFSSAYGRIIKNGKPGKMVKNVMLTGNVFDTLKNIEMIADDLQLFGGLGGCGKGGQSPLPVSFGGPHVLIRDVLIGGRQ